MFIPRLTIRLVLLASLVVALTTCRVDAQLVSEHEVKAGFLVNFAKFTEWPTAAFTDPTAPIVIGIAGDDTLRHAVDNLAGGKSLNGRGLKTKNVKDPKDASSTHLVFIGNLLEHRAAEILKALSGLPVLTVGESDRFCGAGGMIAFLQEKDRLRFEIRFDATEQAGLKVSSRVLALAKTVHGKK